MKVSDILFGKTERYCTQEITQAQVTVILPTYNRAHSGSLQRAVNSVLEQTFQSIELIIVDDASPDNTFEFVCQCMAQDNRVSCIRHTDNIGLPSISVYEGLLTSHGRYIALMFDDNQWVPDAIEKMVHYCDSHGCMAAYGTLEVIGSNENVLIGSSASDISELRYHNIIPNSAVLLRRTVYEDIGLADPHIVLLRNNDYDHWLRLTEKYHFYATDIFFGYEYGPSMKDSLGNMYQSDCWAWREYIRKDRSEQLKLENYGDCDPFAVPDAGVSDFLRECMHVYLDEHCEKCWYTPQLHQQIETGYRREIRRVAVLTADISASLTPFYRCPYDSGLVIQFFGIREPLEPEIAYADTVVISRNLDMAESKIEMFRNMNMRLYYFTDDCFRVIDGSQDIYVKRAADRMTPEFLNRFDGVLLTTVALVTYFREKNLHHNLILLEPVCRSLDRGMRTSQSSEILTVIFTGGTFREEVLLNTVFPALCRIAKEHSVRFCCPDDRQLRKLLKFESDMESVFIPRTKSLEQMLESYRAYAPSIQVHCGPDNANNIFKTENALINATEMGAILIASDLPPYNHDGRPYLRAENTSESWYVALKCATDPLQRKSLLEQAEKYCQRYNGEQVVNAMVEEFMALPACTQYCHMKRSEILYGTLLNMRLAEPSGLYFYAKKVREYVCEYGWRGYFKVVRRAITKLKNYFAEVCFDKKIL